MQGSGRLSPPQHDNVLLAGHRGAAQTEKINLLGPDDTPIDTSVLLPHLNSACNKKSAIGGSIRWAVAVADGGKLELQLQGLPLPAGMLASEPLMRADNVATIVLASHPLNADLFDGGSHAGPVPVLFAADKDMALVSLLANPDVAFEGTGNISK
jgi:hypothetical protein